MSVSRQPDLLFHQDIWPGWNLTVSVPQGVLVTSVLPGPVPVQSPVKFVSLIIRARLTLLTVSRDNPGLALEVVAV